MGAVSHNCRTACCHETGEASAWVRINSKSSPWAAHDWRDEELICSAKATGSSAKAAHAANMVRKLAESDLECHKELARLRTVFERQKSSWYSLAEMSANGEDNLDMLSPRGHEATMVSLMSKLELALAICPHANTIVTLEAVLQQNAELEEVLKVQKVQRKKKLRWLVTKEEKQALMETKQKQMEHAPSLNSATKSSIVALISALQVREGRANLVSYLEKLAEADEQRFEQPRGDMASIINASDIRDQGLKESLNEALAAEHVEWKSYKSRQYLQTASARPPSNSLPKKNISDILALERWEETQVEPVPRGVFSNVSFQLPSEGQTQ